MNMIFDDENDILRYAREDMKYDSVLQFNGNSFNKKILKCLLDEDKLISDNGHAASPPDFYSPAHNMMFDVLRVNDSEVKKTYNPVKIRERDRHNKIGQKFGDMLASNGKIFIVSESDDLDEHTYKHYVKNAQRVIGEHIKKIPLWVKKCPDIKHKGLFVFDETEVYYQGGSMPNDYSEPDKSWVRAIRMDCCLHKPWLDEKFIRQIYESELDFVIWFCPYKPHGIARQSGMEFPCAAIIDTRFYFDKYVAYPDDLIC